jgi:putative membrane protein
MTCAIGLQRGLLSVVQPACGRTILEMSVAMKSEEEGQLRDRLARERTKLAIERTILAYIRTALAFVVVGIPAIFMFESRLIQALGGVSIFLGIVVAAVGVYRYADVKRALQEPPPSVGNGGDG